MRYSGVRTIPDVGDRGWLTTELIFFANIVEALRWAFLVELLRYLYAVAPYEMDGGDRGSCSAVAPPIVFPLVLSMLSVGTKDSFKNALRHLFVDTISIEHIP